MRKALNRWGEQAAIETEWAGETYSRCPAESEEAATASRRSVMSGILVFNSLPEALRAGYQVYDRLDEGYLLRTRTAAGWAMAICRVNSRV